MKVPCFPLTTESDIPLKSAHGASQLCSSQPSEDKAAVVPTCESGRKLKIAIWLNVVRQQLVFPSRWKRFQSTGNVIFRLKSTGEITNIGTGNVLHLKSKMLQPIVDNDSWTRLLERNVNNDHWSKFRLEWSVDNDGGFLNSS